LGGTRSPEAFDKYLRGRRLVFGAHGPEERLSAIGAFTDAIRLDDNFALAYAARSLSYSRYAEEFASGASTRAYFDKSLADARRALELAPDLADGHVAMGLLLESGSLDFDRAEQAYARARALAPGNAQVLRFAGAFAVYIGHFDRGLADLRRAVTLDPLNLHSHAALGLGLYLARRYREAAAALTQAINLDPGNAGRGSWLGLVYYALGDLASARASCETNTSDWSDERCLALVYDKVGRRSDAEAAFAKLKTIRGDASAYQYATIYAQWGDSTKAFEWLNTAMRLRDPDLELVKNDPLMDPLRTESRFQAMMRELEFPQ
jgi:tetratricopeptide (TPR) repeat protein